MSNTPLRPTDLFRRGRWLLAVTTVIAAGCSSGTPAGEPSATPATASEVETVEAEPVEPDTSVETADTDTDTDVESTIVATIHDDQPGTNFDRRLLGTNVPAWLGPDRLSDPAFHEAVINSGTTLLRMPGGSWSNSYDWLQCQLGNEPGCRWPWAATPTDFIGLMESTGLEGMWTVSINETAQHAAAAVAFFNGDVADTRAIGIDRNGVDWGTVGAWAQFRTSNGAAEPAGISLWEVGNEVYGGRPESGGDECASFGWEDVWTCDGTEYTLGTDEHDGYLTIRAAMVAVDPSIEVGAVGVPIPDEWGDWGNEVIEAAGDDLDFYVAHRYGFNESPEPPIAIERPQLLWPVIGSELRTRLDADIPIAVTEYNLISFAAGDTARSMSAAFNALYIADSIGQMAQSDISIANQWNMANGRTDSGADYGLIDADTYEPFPQYFAMQAWAGAGTTLLEATVDDDSVHLYPTRHDDGRLTVVIVNLNDQPVTIDLEIVSSALTGPMSVKSAVATDLRAETLDVVMDEAAFDAGTSRLTIPGWSITTMEEPLNG